MFIIKEKYPIYYFEGDYSDLVAVPHETFFQDKNGQIYSQFYPGQLIPKEIFDRIFGNKEKVEKLTKTEESPILDTSPSKELEEDIPSKLEENTIEEVSTEPNIEKEVIKVEKEESSKESSQPKAKEKKKK